MFKAKLIENEGYYKLRSKQLLLMLLPPMALGLLINFYLFPTWVTFVMIGIYILAIVIVSKNQKLMNSLVGHKLIEIDETEIRIKHKNGKQQESFSIDDAEKVIVKGEYGIPQGTMKEIANEMKGNPKKNYLIIQQHKQQRKLDFEINSHYMAKQLNKTISTWISKGYNVERE